MLKKESFAKWKKRNGNFRARSCLVKLLTCKIVKEKSGSNYLILKDYEDMFEQWGHISAPATAST